MKEYIERAAVLSYPIRADRCDKNNANEHFIFGIESVIEYVENLPAADVAEVRRGRWADPEDDGGYTSWYCSLCNHPVGTIGGYPNWKHCPNCGARMDKEDEHEQ